MLSLLLISSYKFNFLIEKFTILVANSCNLEKFKVIGLMSGTSLDGLDIAYCEFWLENNKWNFKILKGETIAYTSEWKNRFLACETSTALQLIENHKAFGAFCGNAVKQFCAKHNFSPDFVSSHGHTIFHQPQKNITFQLGCGATIAAVSGFKTVCDFRSTDVALGGQGAPLVPIGDDLLFAEYDYCLNLGGFANVSFNENGKRIAFDVCPTNIVLNYLSEQKGKAYDENGNWAKNGNTNIELLNTLNNLPFYSQNGPKSLGKEWVIESIFPLLKNNILVDDLLNTFTLHIAEQIATVLKNGKVLVTGGGAFNSFLMEQLQQKTEAKIIIPDVNNIQFKEALLFAFLGVLRFTEQNNSLQSVTGASRDNCGGAIYL